MYKSDILLTSLSASILEKQKAVDTNDWPAYGTFGWLAVMYAILALGMTFSNKTLAQVKQWIPQGTDAIKL